MTIMNLTNQLSGDYATNMFLKKLIVHKIFMGNQFYNFVDNFVFKDNYPKFT